MMARYSAVIYVAVGVVFAEAVVWGALLPWAHYRYTTGISLGTGLWKPVALLAAIGGALGLATFFIRRVVNVR